MGVTAAEPDRPIAALKGVGLHEDVEPPLRARGDVLLGEAADRGILHLPELDLSTTAASPSMLSTAAGPRGLLPGGRAARTGGGAGTGLRSRCAGDHVKPASGEGAPAPRNQKASVRRDASGSRSISSKVMGGTP